jgi:integrase
MPYQYVREPLTAEEADRLANACETPTEQLIVWTLLDTGLRVGELCDLTSKKVADPGERAELAARAVAEKMTGAEVRAAGEGRAPRPRRLEHRDRNRSVVTVPDGLDDEDALAAVQRALKAWRKAEGRQDAA